MNASFVRVALVAIILIAAWTILARPTFFVVSENASAAATEEGWSFDDIKDVCEAFHFVMISIGIGCGLYWFWTSWVPSQGAVCIEFAVDAERVGETETARIVELVAWVKNIGKQSAKLSELQFTLRSIHAGHTAAGAALMKQADVEPFLETTPKPASFVVDAGAQRRCVLAVTVPKSLEFALVTARVKSEQRVELYEASKLVGLNV